MTINASVWALLISYAVPQTTQCPRVLGAVIVTAEYVGLAV
jgi:hypothetical protein